MSLLKKLLGKKASEPGRLFRNRPPRVPLATLHRVSFRRLSPASGDIPVFNVSIGGLGLIQDAANPLPPPGVLVEGDLTLGEKSFSIRLRIAHHSSAVVGGAFESPSPELIVAIRRYFEVELAALSLDPVNPDVMKAVPKGKPRWFLGERNCELYFIEHEGQVLHFYGSFLGNYFEGGEEHKTRFGHVKKDSPLEERTYAKSELIQFDSKVVPEMVDVIAKFIRNITRLEEPWKDKLCVYLERAKSG